MHVREMRRWSLALGTKQGALLSTAAHNLFTNHGIFRQLGHSNSHDIVENVVGNGRDDRGAGDGREFRAAKQEAHALLFSPGFGHRSRNSDGKGVGDCGARRMKNVDSNRPSDGHSVRNFAVKGAGMDEKTANPKSAAEEPEESLKVVEYLNSLRNFEKEGVPKGAGTESEEGFDLRRVSCLLLRLGDPLSKFPVVHVAGTKGKGSTVSFLSQILRAAGFRVGSYTSPHINSLRERIVAGTTGQAISTKALNELFDDVQETIHEAVVAEAGALTHFEVLTALAFVHFAREEVDVAVVEAGLGGARDATNVIQASGLLAAVIVGIGEDHLEALGGSLESIALAKAGIIKHGRPVILGKQAERIAEDLVRQAATSKNSIVLPAPGLNARLYQKGICADSAGPHQICDIALHQIASDDRVRGANEVWELKDLKIPALGAHQLDNVATAIQTALCLRREGWEISDAAIRLGVERTTLPGRFQVATPAEALKLGAHGSTVIFDGAHTSGSGAALARTLREVFPEDCVAVVVAMASDKDHQGFARAILEGTEPSIVVATRVDIAGSLKRSLPSRILSDSFTRAGKDLNLTVIVEQESDPDIRSTTSEASSATGPVGMEDSSGIRLLRRERALLVREAETIQLAIAKASELVLELSRKRPGVICITGSLHAVSSTMSLLSSTKK